MSPQRLREYVLIVTRDIVPCSAGAYLVHKGFPSWQLPLVLGLFSIPVVAPRGPKPPKDAE